MTQPTDPHLQALHDHVRAEHEAWIAEVQSWADSAGEAGDTARQRRHLEHVQRLKAMPYPGEQQHDAA